MRTGITIAVENTFNGLAPWCWKSLTDLQVGRQVYESLVQYDRAGRISPHLAEHWESSDNGMTWMFRVRSGACFHDGRLVSSDAIAGDLADRVLPLLGLSDRVQAVTVLDSSAFQLKLASPFVPLLARLASPLAVVCASGGSADPAPAGTGPYKLKATDDSGWPVLERVKYRCAKSIDSIRYLPMPSGGDMWAALKGGTVDVIYECPYGVIADPPACGGVVIESMLSLSVNMLLFNSKSARFEQLSRRTALARSINRETLFRFVNESVGAIAESPISPASRFHVPKEHHRAAEPVGEPTRKGERFTLLASAGYGRKFLAQLREQVERGGFQCDVVELDFPELMWRLRSGNFEAALTGMLGSDDPDLLMYDGFHSRGLDNYSGFESGEYDQLVEHARVCHDDDIRRRLYAQAVEVIHANVPAVFFRHGMSVVAHNAAIHGIRPYADNYLRVAEGRFA